MTTEMSTKSWPVHGFVDVENRIARYEQLLGFVQRNLLSPAKRP
jgi:hypothetical protein